jgi:hypothetical protein
MTKNNQNYILYDKFKNCGSYKGQEEGQLTSDNIHYIYTRMSIESIRWGGGVGEIYYKWSEMM